MNTGEGRQSGSRPMMVVRRYGWGRNPLRRGTDRIESAVVVLAVLAGLLAVPVAAAFGSGLGKAMARESDQIRVTARPVQVTTVEDASPLAAEQPGTMSTMVRATWTGSDGVPHEVDVQVLDGSKAGKQLTVWIDGSGAVVRTPQSKLETAAVGAVAGIGALILSWFGLVFLVGVTGLVLGRWRSRYWQTEWARVAPLWNRR